MARRVAVTSMLLLCASMAFGRVRSVVDHVCVHDEPHMQAAQAALLRNNPVIQTHGRGGGIQSKATGQFRIVIDGTTTSDSGKYCTAASGTVPTFATQGETIACDADSVLTDAKRTLLLDTIIPQAITRIQSLLQVEQTSSNIVASSSTECGDFTIPASHTSTGVADADLVIYVAAGPIDGNTVAFASGCSANAAGRTVIGRMNFDPEHIPTAETDIASSGIVDVAVHEMTHVLGVTSTNLAATSTTVTKRGKSVTYNTLPGVQAWARTYTGCSTLEGGEIEDEGSGGSVGSHWERKVWYEEVMAATAGIAMSGLTLSFLVGLNSEYSLAAADVGETMEWGSGWGCGIHNAACNTAEGGMGNYYCFTENADNCTYNLKAVGTCSVSTYTADLPSYFQYFVGEPAKGGPQFMDGCPIWKAYSNRQCSVPRRVAAADLQAGQSFSTESRCFYADPGTYEKDFTAEAGYRCHQAKCDASGTLFFAPGTETTYTACPSAGASVTIPDGSAYGGAVLCPDPTRMCAGLTAATSGFATHAAATEPPNGDGNPFPNPFSCASPLSPWLLVLTTLVALLLPPAAFTQ